MLTDPLIGLPIVQTEMLGPRPFCEVVDNMEVTSGFDLVRRPGQHILCNAAGLALLKAEIERRNSEAHAHT